MCVCVCVSVCLCDAGVSTIAVKRLNESKWFLVWGLSQKTYRRELHFATLEFRFAQGKGDLPESGCGSLKNIRLADLYAVLLLIYSFTFMSVFGHGRPYPNNCWAVAAVWWIPCVLECVGCVTAARQNADIRHGDTPVNMTSLAGASRPRLTDHARLIDPCTENNAQQWDSKQVAIAV